MSMMPTQPPTPTPPWGKLVLRGFLKRCANCGGGKLFRGYFHMKDRCPTCAIRFEREKGFFVGSYLINFAFMTIALFGLSMVYVAMKVANPDAGVAPLLIAGLVIAVVLPIIAYPIAQTLWSAIDIGMTPLEPHELAEAIAFQAAEERESGPSTTRAGDQGPGSTSGNVNS